MEFVEASLETLDYDTVLKILEKMSPKDVLSLCQTSSGFAEYCRSQEVFRHLMRKDYPIIVENFGIADDAKDQYVRITNNVYAYYAVEVQENTLTKKDSQGNYITLFPLFGKRAKFIQDHENTEEMRVFPTLSKLRVGRKYWFSVCDKASGSQNLVFATKEIAVEEFLDMHYDDVIGIISKKYENFEDDEFREIDDPAFLDFLEEQHLPLDLSREGLREYLMENGFLNLDPMGDDPDDFHIFQVFEVIIEG